MSTRALKDAWEITDHATFTAGRESRVARLHQLVADASHAYCNEGITSRSARIHTSRPRTLTSIQFLTWLSVLMEYTWFEHATLASNPSREHKSANIMRIVESELEMTLGICSIEPVTLRAYEM